MANQELERQQAGELSPVEAVIAHVRNPQMREQIEALSGGKFSVERFVAVAVTAMRNSPDVVAVSRTPKGRNSIVTAVARCAQDGLFPNGREAALVKFGDEITYMPMVDGLKKIAAEHGWTLRARVVYANDDFSYADEPPDIVHRNTPPGKARGDVIAAYAIAMHRDGRRIQTMLTADDIAKRRNVARSKKVWDDWYPQMAEKSAARDLFNDIPFADSDRERITRILAADSTSAQSERLLYGSEDLNQPPTPDLPSASAALAPGPQPGASEAGSAGGVPLKAPADPAHVEPEPSLDDGERSQPLAIVDPAVLAAQAAAHFRPPDGQYRDLSFSEIQESGPKGEGWFGWALRTIMAPPAYVQALRDYTRVYLPETYTRVMAEMEAW